VAGAPFFPLPHPRMPRPAGGVLSSHACLSDSHSSAKMTAAGAGPRRLGGPSTGRFGRSCGVAGVDFVGGVRRWWVVPGGPRKAGSQKPDGPPAAWGQHPGLKFSDGPAAGWRRGGVTHDGRRWGGFVEDLCLDAHFVTGSRRFWGRLMGPPTIFSCWLAMLGTNGVWWGGGWCGVVGVVVRSGGGWGGGGLGGGGGVLRRVGGGGVTVCVFVGCWTRGGVGE